MATKDDAQGTKREAPEAADSAEAAAADGTASAVKATAVPKEGASSSSKPVPRKRQRRNNISWNDIKVVQNLIERCVQQYMTQAEIVTALKVSGTYGDVVKADVRLYLADLPCCPAALFLSVPLSPCRCVSFCLYLPLSASLINMLFPVSRRGQCSGTAHIYLDSISDNPSVLTPPPPLTPNAHYNCRYKPTSILPLRALYGKNCWTKTPTSFMVTLSDSD